MNTLVKTDRRPDRRRVHQLPAAKPKRLGDALHTQQLPARRPQPNQRGGAQLQFGDTPEAPQYVTGQAAASPSRRTSRLVIVRAS